MKTLKLEGKREATQGQAGWTVTFICQEGPTLLGWVTEILEKGGVPTIQILSSEVIS